MFGDDYYTYTTNYLVNNIKMFGMILCYLMVCRCAYEKSMFEYRDHLLDETAKKFSNAIIGIEDVYDPDFFRF